MNKNIISIIIPVFNAENTLRRCIKSVINQSYRNIEVILVNDGSTDNSTIICEEYASKDNRIKVIHISNQGVSVARNIGLQNSTGAYIQFVDSDDYLHPEICSKLIYYMTVHDYDLIICGYYRDFESNIVLNKGFNLDILSKDDWAEEFSNIYERYFLHSLWNKLYKKNLIQCYFSKELSLGEDLLFNLHYIKNIKKIKFIPDMLYYYSVSEKGSLSSTFNLKNFEIILFLYNQANRFSKIYFKDNMNRTGIANVLLNNILSLIISLIQSSELKYNEKKFILISWINIPEIQESINNSFTTSTNIRVLKLLLKYRMINTLMISITTFLVIKNTLPLNRSLEHKS